MRGYMTAYALAGTHFCTNAPSDYCYGDPCENRHYKFTAVEYPGETVFITEISNWCREHAYPRVYCPFLKVWWEDYPWPEMRGWAPYPKTDFRAELDAGSGDAHNDGGNFGFVDGHAKWVKRSQACAGALEALAGGGDNAKVLSCMRMWGHEFGCGYNYSDYE